MEEFLVEFFAGGRQSIETHPFVCNGDVIVDSEGQPILRNNLPIISQSWCLGERPPEHWKTNEAYFGFLPAHGIQHLFIGTFPPQSVTFGYGQNVPFFYGSNDNLMWRIMPRLTNIPAVGRDFFTNYSIGVTDVLRSVRRTKFGGSDTSFKPIHYNNIHLLLEQYEHITDIYFTSSGFGKSAFGWTHLVLQENLPRFPSASSIKRLTFIPEIFFGRRINVHFLYSPSDLANQQIYRNRKSIFYSKLAAHYELPDVDGQLNKFLSRTIATHLDLPQACWVYRLFQWANCLRGVEGVVRPELLEIIDSMQADRIHVFE